MRLFKGKNNLDEMQEQAMLHIEKNAFWILYFLLFVALAIEKIMGFTLREMAAEAICFFFASWYVVAACIRKGIWDRRWKADGKTNVVVSLIGGALAAVVSTAAICVQYPESLSSIKAVAITLGATFGLTFVITFVMCMALMSVCTAAYKRRVKALERREEEEECGSILERMKNDCEE